MDEIRGYIITAAVIIGILLVLHLVIRKKDDSTQRSRETKTTTPSSTQIKKMLAELPSKTKEDNLEKNKNYQIKAGSYAKAKTLPKSPPYTDSNFIEPRRSDWSLVFTFIGCALLVLGLFASIILVDELKRHRDANPIVVIACFSGSLQAFLFGFLINVFTDIRWYLQKIANKDT